MSKKTQTQTPDTSVTTIKITLTGNRTCRFEYSDPTMAREHYDQFRSQGIIAGQIIKSIELV